MRRTLFALGFCTVSAFALASVATAQESVNWTGPYAFVFGQYTGGSSAQNDNGFIYRPPAARPVVVPVAPPPGGGEGGGDGGDGGDAGLLRRPASMTNADGHYGLSGGFGGGGLGYNYQTLWLVLGVEADIGGGRASGSSAFCGNPFHQCGTSIDAVSDVRARLGYAYGRFLPFVSGGLAVDHLRAYDSLFGASGSAWRAGYVVGAGVEYKLSPHVSVRAEYLHTEIGGSHLFDIVPGVQERVSARTDSARLSLVYAFGSVAAPVAARY